MTSPFLTYEYPPYQCIVFLFIFQTGNNRNYGLIIHLPIVFLHLGDFEAFAPCAVVVGEVIIYFVLNFNLLTFINN